MHLHRVRALPSEHVTRRDGLPVTTAARTILDLAEVIGTDDLTRVIGEAEYQRRMTRVQLIAIAQESHGRRGVKRLRAVVGDGSPAPSHSRFEDLFYEAVLRAGLPRPLRNEPLLAYRVDFLWPRHKLVVETDGGEVTRPSSPASATHAGMPT